MTIRIITEPSVYVVGRQQIIPDELGRFLADVGAGDWTTDTVVPAEVLVEVAGRNCYASYSKPRPGGNVAYISHILEAQHGSVIEHASWSFIITGVSRSLTHELVRHRHMSYSQLSQRYVDEGDVAFVVPPAAMAGHDLYFGPPRVFSPEECSHLDVFREWIEAMESAADSYRRLVRLLETTIVGHIADRTERRKAVREAARSVLTNCTETKIFVTANARALRNFLELRGSRHADAEINRLALKLLEILRAKAPNIFGDYRVVTLADGRQEITTEYRKV